MTRSWDRREASAARWHDDQPGHSHGCVVHPYFMVWDYQMTLRNSLVQSRMNVKKKKKKRERNHVK